MFCVSALNFVLWLPLSLYKMSHIYNDLFSEYNLSSFTHIHSDLFFFPFMLLLSQIIPFCVLRSLPHCSSYTYFLMLVLPLNFMV